MKRAAISVTVMTGLLLTACTTSSDSKPHGSSPASTTPFSTASSISPSILTQGPTSGSAKSKPVSRTITDTAYGDTITVLQEARHIPAPDNAKQELVLLRLAIKRGQSATGAGMNAFRISANGQQSGNSQTDAYNGKAKQLGFQTLISSQPLPAGILATGWAVFTVTPAGAHQLVFLYHRPAVVVGGKSVPSRTFSIPLPS